MTDLKSIETYLANALSCGLNYRGPHRTQSQNEAMRKALVKVSDALGDIRFMIKQEEG